MALDPISRATRITMALYWLQPMIIGGWLALIPHIKETLELSKADLAIALLGAPLALLLALQVAGPMVARFGPRRVMMVGFVLQGLAANLPLLATSQMSLFGALMVFGAAIAVMEVGLNVYAGRVERRAGVTIMSRCHGFWSLGLMTGSFLVAQSGLALITAQGVIALFSSVVGIFVARTAIRFPGEAEDKAPPRRSWRAIPVPLLPIGLFMFAFTITEGAMADWAAVHLSEITPEAGIEPGLAVTIFAGAMACGRFVGDALNRWLGPVGLARASAVVSALGLLLLIVPLPLVFVFVGFALTGLGVAAGYPLGISAVAAIDETYEASNIAIISTAALCGFLAGPPLIGFLAEAFSLRIGFAAVLPFLVACLWLAVWVRPNRPESGIESATRSQS
ncbi:MAG: MFS transporter [Pseudomonadota bacterium]